MDYFGIVKSLTFLVDMGKNFREREENVGKEEVVVCQKVERGSKSR